MDTRTFGVKALGDLLPLDAETLGQMIDYGLTLPDDSSVAHHFLNLLGESSGAFDFIARFNELRNAKKAELTAARPSKKASTILANKGVDLSLAKAGTATTKTANQKANQKANPNATHQAGSEDTAAKPAWSTSSQSPHVSSPRLKNNTTSTTVAELLKPAKEPLTPQQKAKKAAKKKLTDLKDIEAALLALEYAEPTEGSLERRLCNCMATRHPLLEAFPNCLNCGKIICVREGLHPCSFCHEPLISWQERAQMAGALRLQKQQLEGTVSEPLATPKPTATIKLPQKKFKIQLGAAGLNGFKAQEWAIGRLTEHNKEKAALLAKEKAALEEVTQQAEELEFYHTQKDVDPEWEKAQAQLSTLLNFQATGAQRTRIIDHASDFDAPSTNGSLWASPLERALQLKKQQRMARKQEEAEAMRSGRGRRVMDLTIRDGKAVIRETEVGGEMRDEDDIPLELVDSEDEELKDIKHLEREANLKRMEAETENKSNVWDYEADRKKWNASVLASATAIDDDLDEPKEETEVGVSGWSRVQQESVEVWDEPGLESLRV